MDACELISPQALGRSLRLGRSCRERGAGTLRLSVPDGLRRLSQVLSRFVRVPGGFVIGSALAFDLLRVPEKQALLMILFNWMMSIILVVGVGLIVLWQSGIDIRPAPQEPSRQDFKFGFRRTRSIAIIKTQHDGVKRVV